MVLTCLRRYVLFDRLRYRYGADELEVTLINRMGTDLTVVNAARVSFNKESKWSNEHNITEEGETYYSNALSYKDQKLVQYLAKHNHWTPFSHVQITMREKVPIFVARQRFKHMVGFTYNEVSRRYVDDPPEFYVPDVWRGAPIDGAKQGSSGEVDEGTQVYAHSPYTVALETCRRAYEELIRIGIAPEQARMVLPQSMYTEYYVTGSLAAWSRAYKLRSTPDAQKEIQELARQWNEIISNIPELKYSWQALITS